MFKNLQLYRLPAPWDMTANKLGAQLERNQFQPCGAMDMQSSGWVPPRDGSYVHAVESQWLVTLCVEQKMLPSSVINQATRERANEIEKQQGHKPGRKEIKEIKERVTDELIPRAFSTRKTVMIWIDPKNGWLAVDTSSQSKAEAALDVLRKALDDLPLSLVRTNASPASSMASWLVGNEAPAGFSVDRDCELRAITEEKATVRYAHHPLDAEDVRQHISDGKQPTRLAMTWNNRLSFVLTDALQVKRLAFLDVVLEEAEEAETAEEQFDASFAIMAGELGRFLPDLVETLGGEVLA